MLFGDYYTIRKIKTKTSFLTFINQIFPIKTANLTDLGI